MVGTQCTGARLTADFAVRQDIACKEHFFYHHNMEFEDMNV